MAKTIPFPNSCSLRACGERRCNVSGQPDLDGWKYRVPLPVKVLLLCKGGKELVPCRCLSESTPHPSTTTLSRSSNTRNLFKETASSAACFLPVSTRSAPPSLPQLDASEYTAPIEANQFAFRSISHLCLSCSLVTLSLALSLSRQLGLEIHRRGSSKSAEKAQEDTTWFEPCWRCTSQ